MKSSLFALALVLSSAGCSHVVPLTAAAAGVQLSANAPATPCRPVGDVGSGARAGDAEDALESARNELKNRAAARGGNYVQLERHAARTTTSAATEIRLGGTAFACPDAPRT